MSKQEAALEVLETPLQEIPDFSEMIARSEVRKANKQAQKVTRESSLQLLKRLFGDAVFDLFPADLMSAVDDAYKFWQANPDSYLLTRFDDMQSLRDAEALMRAYAEVADPAGYTIRTVGSDEPLVLSWRAQTRRTVKSKDDDTDDE